MFRRGMVAVFLGLLAMVPAVLARAQDQSAPATGSIWNVLAGGVAPQTLQLKDLDSNWQVFRLSGSASEGNTLLDAYLLLTGRPADQNTFYTQGKTVTIADQTFLVAYHDAEATEEKRVLSSKGMPAAPPSPLTPQTKLSLCLINIRDIGVLNDIHAFDPAQIQAVTPAAPNVAAIDQQETQVISNLKQLALAMLMYSQDHNEKFPPMKTSASVKKALMRYAKTETIFVDQRDGQAFLPNPRISGKSLADIDAPASTVAFYDPVPDSQGRIYIAFADGHVKGVTPEEWEKIKRASKIP